jgi:hypothetical protein
MEDGSLTDASVGYRYAEKFAAELRFRKSEIIKTEQVSNVPDSLNFVHDTTYEISLFPAEYYFIKDSDAEFRLGAGAYYGYNTLKEKGYINMPELFTYYGKQALNSYSNEFLIHILGPVLDLGFVYRNSDMMRISLSAGVVPIYYVGTRQKGSITPLLAKDIDHSQQSSGSPKFYSTVNIIFLKYFSFSFLYDYSRLKYDVFGFIWNGTDFEWNPSGQTEVSQSFKLEAALLLPVTDSLCVQIGYGRIFDVTKIDSGAAVRETRNYIALYGKVFDF